jgi:hypothetical protein
MVPEGSVKPTQSATARRRHAAAATIEETTRRLRAAKTQADRDLLDAILDRARRSLAAVSRELAKEDGR